MRILSLASSDPADSTLLATSQEVQDVAAEGEDVLMEPSEPACPAYNELLEVMHDAEIRISLEARKATDRL